jgi:hypothetical protein
MKSLYCDVCKKEVVDPIPDRSFFHITSHDLCEPCKDALSDRLRPILRRHVPYTESWYEQTVQELIANAIEADKF